MDTLPPLFFYFNYRVRTHPGTERAADALGLVRDGNGMVALGVDLLAEGEEMTGAHIGAQSAALAGLGGDGQLGHEVPPP